MRRILLPAASAVGLIATAAAAAVDDQALASALQGQWMVFRGEVVTSEPAAELFCANGVWRLQSARRSAFGHYVLRQGELCVEPSAGGRFCRRLSLTSTGALQAQGTAGGRAIETVIPAKADPVGRTLELTPACVSDGAHP